MMNLFSFLPEILLVVGACLLLLIDMFLSDANRDIIYRWALILLLLCAIFSFYVLRTGATYYGFHNMFVSDPMSALLKLGSCIAVAVTFIYSRQYVTTRKIVGGGHLGSEFYVLGLFSLLGQMVMISGNNFLSIYLGLELMSLCLYALVALRRNCVVAIESAMKYFVLGALASGFLLYGMSMLYGSTGSLELTEVMTAVSSGVANRPVLIFGVVFMVAGLAFKLGAAPFHMWVPDVYHGSPTAVTLLLGAAPKLAAFAICIRLLVEGLLPLAFDWQQMLMILAILSMAVGNIAALAQTNLKRMLAYSTIAQTGYMLLGLMSGVVNADAELAVNAYSASLFYSITYVVTTLGTFGMIMLLSRKGFEADNLSDLKGLSERSPWFAFVMLLFMFSLAGIPPVVGFYAKLSVLQAVLATGQIWLVILAVVFSLIGAFYYLRIVKLMYFDAPVDTSPIVVNKDMRLTLSINGLFVLLVGLLPNALMTLCAWAILQTLAT